MPSLREYWRLRDLGKCVNCSARNPDPEFVRCARCREKLNRAKYARRKRDRERGRCMECRAPLAPGYALCLCPECRDRRRSGQGPRSSYLGRLGAGA